MPEATEEPRYTAKEWMAKMEEMKKEALGKLADDLNAMPESKKAGFTARKSWEPAPDKQTPTGAIKKKAFPKE